MLRKAFLSHDNIEKQKLFLPRKTIGFARKALGNLLRKKKAKCLAKDRFEAF